MSSDPYEEARELSRGDIACSERDPQDLEALACEDRALGLCFSAARNCFMEPEEVIEVAGPLPDRLPGLIPDLTALAGIARGVQALAGTELCSNKSDQRHAHTTLTHEYALI